VFKVSNRERKDVDGYWASGKYDGVRRALMMRRVHMEMGR